MGKGVVLIFTIIFALNLGFSSKVVKMQADINTEYTDFAPVPSPDGAVLYFTSMRPNGQGGQDIWVSHQLNGQWTQPVSLSSPLNTIANEGADQFSYDSSHLYLYLTLCNREDGKGMCDIYISMYDSEGNWTQPKNLGAPINSEFTEANAFFDRSQNILYFISNRPGGLGQRGRTNEASFDIWFSQKNPDGTWTEPKNSGNKINTPDTEAKIFFDPATGWMFFSSDGHREKGKADIFKVKRLGIESWGEIIPVEAVNSQGNDLYFTIPEGADYAFFSSDVEGADNIYIVPLSEIYTEKELKARRNYYLANPPPAVPAVGDLAKAYKNRFCAGMISPKPISPQPDLINTIYFGLDSAVITNQEEKVLETWTNWLKDNPGKKVELKGHTDNLGDATYNLILSMKRADNVKYWLIKKGVKPEQVFTAYYGLTRPIEPNEPNLGNPKNRRVEITVIE